MTEKTIPIVDDDKLAQLIAEGQASAGMIAKLLAGRTAASGGVSRVYIVDGRKRGALEGKRGPRNDHGGGDRNRTEDESAMTNVAEEVIGMENTHILQVYKRLPVVLIRGEGSRIVDAEGHEYVDLLSGIGVTSLGYAHPGLATAIASQAQELLHTSNLFFHVLQGELAARLAALSGLPRAFFCNSGTEAVEACLKFARTLLAHPGADRSKGDRGLRSFVSWPDLRVSIGHVRRAVSRAVRAARARSGGSSRPKTRPRFDRRSLRRLPR